MYVYMYVCIFKISLFDAVVIAFPLGCETWQVYVCMYVYMYVCIFKISLFDAVVIAFPLGCETWQVYVCMYVCMYVFSRSACLMLL